MITITLMVRPTDSLVWIPTTGSLRSLDIQAVVPSGDAASLLRARITTEVAALADASALLSRDPHDFG
ncbi:MAG: hypothetical protein V4531_01240 [Actinomycetota bacterium]